MFLWASLRLGQRAGRPRRTASHRAEDVCSAPCGLHRPVAWTRGIRCMRESCRPPGATTRQARGSVWRAPQKLAQVRGTGIILETAVDRLLPLGKRYELQLSCARARSPYGEWHLLSDNQTGYSAAEGGKAEGAFRHRRASRGLRTGSSLPGGRFDHGGRCYAFPPNATAGPLSKCHSPYG